LPLVMLFVNRIGLVSVQTYVEKWRIAIMVIFVLSMFLTPADPISMLLLAIPLTACLRKRIHLVPTLPQASERGDSAQNLARSCFLGGMKASLWFLTFKKSFMKVQNLTTR